MGLTHLDKKGNIAMVDVSGKPGTLRSATASGYIRMQPATIELLSRDGLPKGNVLCTAKLAGILAAKNTAHLIPLCHQLNLSWADIVFDVQETGIAIRATVKTKESTGVEMEALTAVSVAALTIYDMCKAVDKSMEIGLITLEKKTGGKSHDTVGYRPKTSILVLSDSVASGRAVDRSGSLLREGFERAGCPIGELRIIADNADSAFSQSAVTVTAQDDEFHSLTVRKLCDRFGHWSFQDDCLCLQPRVLKSSTNSFKIQPCFSFIDLPVY